MSDETERAIAKEKSYVGPAIMAFLLYWFFYWPGLVANVLYLAGAWKTAKIAGKAPRA